ncbi:MAG: ArsA-related P-loop ATPase [Myxococcota bacterium]
MLPALKRRVIVCVGCGGVGKTTVASAVALQAAQAGRRALVLTIDPARRLADALGVEALGNQPEAIPREVLDRLGVPASGALSAMMLDMKRTFDDLVERLASSPDTRDRVLANPIYQHVSDALSGSVEYSAMEKVYEMAQSDAFDTIVVDTPPSQHALDFLDAPERILQFLDSRLVQMWIHPAFAAGRAGVRWFQWGTRRALSLIERITGLGFLEDVSEFLLAFEEMSEGFRRHAREVSALLRGPDAAFVLIAGPETESVAQARRFLERLEATELHAAGIVANRVRAWPGNEAPLDPDLSAVDPTPLVDALREQRGADFPADEAAEAALGAARRYAALVARDDDAVRELRGEAERRGAFFRQVPEFSAEVHDLGGIGRVAGALTLVATADEPGQDD